MIEDCSPSATMRQKSKAEESAERNVKEIKRQAQRKFSAEEKGMEKVKTEMSLCVLAYNLKRMIAILGVEPLIAAIRA